MTIKPHSNLLTLLLAFIFLTLAACGGGGGGPTPAAQAQEVTVTIGLQGSAATVVGSVDLEILLPNGFLLASDSDSSSQPKASPLTYLVSGATAVAHYTPETVAANGEITAGFIKSDGFAGNANLLQISCPYAGATLPTADDFMVTLVASDLDGAALSGISERINISTQAVP